MKSSGHVTRLYYHQCLVLLNLLMSWSLRLGVLIFQGSRHSFAEVLSIKFNRQVIHPSSVAAASEITTTCICRPECGWSNNAEFGPPTPPHIGLQKVQLFVCGIVCVFVSDVERESALQCCYVCTIWRKSVLRYLIVSMQASYKVLILYNYLPQLRSRPAQNVIKILLCSWSRHVHVIFRRSIIEVQGLSPVTHKRRWLGVLQRYAKCCCWLGMCCERLNGRDLTGIHVQRISLWPWSYPRRWKSWHVGSRFDRHAPPRKSHEWMLFPLLIRNEWLLQ